MLSKRNFLLSLMLSVTSAIGYAQNTSPSKPIITVVKIMSFSCPVCKASEPQDSLIQQAVSLVGGVFVKAPVPSLEADTGAKDRFYYGARSMGPAMAQKVSDSLYKGSQEMGVPLNDAMSTYVWLQQDLGAKISPQDLSKLSQLGQDAQSEAALNRAYRLAGAAGVDAIPAYVILVNNSINASLDASMYPQGLSTLRDAVIAKIASLSKTH